MIDLRQLHRFAFLTFAGIALGLNAASAQQADVMESSDQVGGMQASGAISAVDGSVSFQGYLEDNGSPANGSYDFRLRVYDALSGGSLQGSSHLAGNVQVTNGTFSVEADFGTAQFWEDDRWIQVEVRDGASTGSYDVISPRTKVNAAPLALALPGVFANPDGSFVGIGRSLQESSAEAFGVYSPATGGFGGMYISTAGGSGDPFYGYAPGGSVQAYHYVEGSSNRWHLYNGGSERLTVESGGDVGIGVTNPVEMLHIDGTDADILLGDPNAEHILLEGNIGSGAIARFYTVDDVETVRINSHGTNATGQILMYSVDGLTNTIDINAVEAAGQGGQITMYNGSGTATVEIDADFGAGSGNPGRITVDELELNGSDVAEHFDIHLRPESPLPKPGMVVSIDPDEPGDLMISHEEYDRKVVGVISGAGDIRTGIYMSQKGTIADGAHPVAVAGRVYVLADAQNGKIEPGDQLTTSDRPGYAMRATSRDRSHGAVLGKAMTGLEKGTGLVLLFISQQ